MNEFAKRVLAPLALPAAAAAFIAVLVAAFASILLAVEKMASTTLALLISAEILGICAVFAAATRVKPGQKALVFLSGLGILAGGAVSANIGIRHIEVHSAPIPIAAKNIEFDKDVLGLEPGVENVVEFANNDASIPHNVAIYTDESASEELFIGEVFNGIATKAYQVPPIEAGSYFFRCDVHPDMKGTVEVAEGAAHGGEPGGHGEEHVSGGSPSPEATASPTNTIAASPTERPSGAATGGPFSPSAEISATGLAFDTSQFKLAADTDVKIEFTITDSMPHNVAIYRDQEMQDNVFRGEVFSGPGSRVYSFKSPEAGKYFFKCDVHPQMKGDVFFG